VIAVLSGRVTVADWLGGYGLTVIIEHNDQTQTLYAHLSELFVKPGDRIAQGEVLGRVGSTGNSTGPHLHFEMRHLTAQGWVAVDPTQAFDAFALGEPHLQAEPVTASTRPKRPARPLTLLEYRMSQLVQSLRSPAEPVSNEPRLNDS
jgi:murein DD-endopeptidase MepM/ murein hydrolase activator NlpD